MKTKHDVLNKRFISHSIEEWGLDNLLNPILEKLRYIKSAPSTLDEALVNITNFLNLKEVLEKQPSSSSKTILMNYLEYKPFFECDYSKIAHKAYELSFLYNDNYLFFGQDDILYRESGRIPPEFLEADLILTPKGVSFTTEMIPKEHKSTSLLLKEILDNSYSNMNYVYTCKVDLKIIFPDTPHILLKNAVTISFGRRVFSFYFDGRKALNKELKTLYQRQIEVIPESGSSGC